MATVFIQLAEAVAEGACANLFAIDVDGSLPEEAWTALDSADAIIFGSPTYMGGPSWHLKRLADASSKAWFQLKWKNKLFGGLTNSASLNGDKLNTLQYFVLLAGQHGGLSVSLAMKPANVKASKRDDPNRMGAYSLQWPNAMQLPHRPKCQKETLRQLASTACVSPKCHDALRQASDRSKPARPKVGCPVG